MKNSNENENVSLKKGRATFNLVGKAKVNENTFKLGTSYDSGWTDNKMYIGIDCGNDNIVFAEMYGGYFPNRDNSIRTFGSDGEQIEVAWDDRFDETIIDSVSPMRLFTVGVETDDNGKTIYHKFLTSYDAVEYLSRHLDNGYVVNVKGNLKYSAYKDEVSVKKEITSFVLSKAEPDDYKATFNQTMLIDRDSVGKYDSERNSFGISSYCVDYVGNVKIDGKKIAIKKNICFPFLFEFDAKDNKNNVETVLNKFFKAKRGEIDQIAVTGRIIESGTVKTITKDDLDSDILELISQGILSEELVLNKPVISSSNNGNRERRFVIDSPDLVRAESGKYKIALETGIYTENDLVFYEQALLEAGVDETPKEDVENFKDISSEDLDLLNQLIGNN